MFNQSSAASGGLIWDSLGSYVVGFSVKLGNCLIIHAELCGAYYGLMLAFSQGYCMIHLEMDSKSVTMMCKEGVVPHHPCYSLVQVILRLLDDDWEVEISHILRQANNTADCFAKAGHNYDTRIVYYQSSFFYFYFLFCK